MSFQRQFGAVLFSSVVLLSVTSLRFPIRSMLRGTNSEYPAEQSNASQPPAQTGDLVHRDSVGFSLGRWRVKHSSLERRTERDSCVLVVVNDIDEPVLLCWVDQGGVLRHYNRVNDRSIRDNSVSNVHGEYTTRGDHFVCIHCSDRLPATLRDVSFNDFIFSYTPSEAGVTHTVTLSKGTRHLRGAPGSILVNLHCQSMQDNGEVIDSSSKVYEMRNICGFTVYYEPGVFEEVPGFETTFVADIAQLSCLLPDAACSLLRAHTPIYINKSLTYGTTKNPIVATNCCYHPMGGTAWLRSNGLNLAKEGCVEVFSADSYLKARDHWGTGGVLVHEFSHVFHDKHCPGGYNCEDIRNAYNAAMRAGLYDCVPVHGPQGINPHSGERIAIKAYACTNCMEFFAELSVAYHYALDETEYNKWYPHNRLQLLQHDPATFEMLERIWHHHD